MIHRFIICPNKHENKMNFFVAAINHCHNEANSLMRICHLLDTQYVQHVHAR